jgi:hypothetical protein
MNLRDRYIDPSRVELQYIRLLYDGSFLFNIDSLECNTGYKKFNGFFRSSYDIDIIQDKTYTILICYNNINYYLTGVKFVDKKHFGGILPEIKYEFIYEHLS